MKTKPENIKLIVIDFLCGAGGVTSGFEEAKIRAQKIAKVIAGLNHDEIAIDSHGSNFLHVKHFIKDLREIDFADLQKLIDFYRKRYPGAKIVFWFSLECTNFSKAKGGLPRNADSRTLAEELIYKRNGSDRRKLTPGYVPYFMPDYVMIENVEEFMSWGPLDENGKPISKRNGSDYVKWCNKIQSFGYRFEHEIINAADLGAYTSRKRYFGIFAKHGLPIAFPEATHAKNPQKQGMFGKLEKWKAVRDVLDLNDHGKSIFGRKKDLSEKTLARIYAGLVKYIAGGKEAFLLKYNSINKETGKHVPPGIDEPCPTIAVQNRLGIVQPQFISKYFSGKPEGKNISVEGPAGTVKCIDGQALVSTEFIIQSHGGDPTKRISTVDSPSRTVTAIDNKSLIQPQFFVKYHGKWDDSSSVEKPLGTITTKEREAFITAQFIDKQYSGEANHQSVDQPAGSVLANDKHALVTSQFIEIKHSQGKQHQSIDNPSGSITTVTKENLITAEPFIVDSHFKGNASSIEKPLPTITANRKWHYLVNPQWGVNSGSSIDDPCFTIIARLDKTPPYIVTTEEGFLAIEIFKTDTDHTRKIKEFMAMYGIIDIKMRMLKVNELLKIQGFPEGYILKGNQADQKKFIGNAVVPLVAQRMAEALAVKLIEIEEKEEAA
jgi:DNA (cytosine-5)-methyltransferase 1